MISKTDSWKQKVDPAIVPLLKTFIHSMDTQDENIVRDRTKGLIPLLKDKGCISFKCFYENINDSVFIQELNSIGESFGRPGSGDTILNYSYRL